MLESQEKFLWKVGFCLRNFDVGFLFDQWENVEALTSEALIFRSEQALWLTANHEPYGQAGARSIKAPVSN